VFCSFSANGIVSCLVDGVGELFIDGVDGLVVVKLLGPVGKLYFKLMLVFSPMPLKEKSSTQPRRFIPTSLPNNSTQQHQQLFGNIGPTLPKHLPPKNYRFFNTTTNILPTPKQNSNSSTTTL